jgi:hypothetical protein
VKNLQSIGPISLGLVNPHEMIERDISILARGRQLLEQPLGAVHEPGAQVIQRKSERRLVAQSDTSLVTQTGMDGNSSIDFAPPPEEAAQCELNFGGIAVGLSHAREDLGGVIESVVDEVIEADVIVTRQAHGTRRSHAATEKPRSSADGYECQREQKWGQLEHEADDSSSKGRTLPLNAVFECGPGVFQPIPE